MKWQNGGSSWPNSPLITVAPGIRILVKMCIGSCAVSCARWLVSCRALGRPCTWAFGSWHTVNISSPLQCGMQVFMEKLRNLCDTKEILKNPIPSREQGLKNQYPGLHSRITVLRTVRSQNQVARKKLLKQSHRHKNYRLRTSQQQRCYCMVCHCTKDLLLETSAPYDTRPSTPGGSRCSIDCLRWT